MKIVVFLLVLSFKFFCPITACAGQAAKSSKLSFEEMIFKATPSLKKDLKKEGWTLDKSEAGKGYIKVEGQFEGIDQYFLFRGQPSDIVIHDMQDQSLELKQNFSFYLFTGDSMKRIKRKDVFPEKEIKAAYLHGRKALEKLEKGSPWEEHIESFKLPIYDRSIELLISSSDPNFYDNEKSVQAVVATMEWTGTKFQIHEVKEPAIHKMSGK